MVLLILANEVLWAKQLVLRNCRPLCVEIRYRLVASGEIIFQLDVQVDINAVALGQIVGFFYDAPHTVFNA